MSLRTKTIWETLKENPAVILCCIYANFGALMYGYDNLALSLCLSMVPFQQVKSQLYSMSSSH